MEHFADLVNCQLTLFNETVIQCDDLDALCDRMYEKAGEILGAAPDEAVNVAREISKQLPVMFKDHERLEQRINELRKELEDLHDAQCFCMIYWSSRDMLVQMIQRLPALDKLVISLGENLESLKQDLVNLCAAESD